MNELQLGLLGAGAVILVGVIGYNAWQSAKVHRKMPRVTSKEETSLTLTEVREKEERPFIEPLHDPVHERASLASKAASNVSEEPVLSDRSDSSGSMSTQSHLEEGVADKVLADATGRPDTDTASITIDPRIDCVVPLHLAQPAAAEEITTLARKLKRAGHKPVLIEGQAEDGDWQSLQLNVHYQQLRVAVQLANRSGPLDEVEFSEFINGVQALADALNAEADFPDMLEIVARARELDTFAMQCDRQLSINLMSDGAPWSANYVQTIVAQDSLLLSRDGTRFVKLDAQQHPVFMLQFGNTNFLRDDLTYKGGQVITLLLDVPVANEDISPFKLMCDYATSLSQRIGARIVDDQRQPLPNTTLQAIEKQLSMFYTKLKEAGLSAGSPEARRLFSH